MIQDKIKELASKYANEFIDVRHHLHAHPELSFNEFKTSEFVQEKLKSWNIDYQILATTGVVGIIKGKNPDEKVIALRADMDALPINELNEVDYKSKNNGVMHACGHDVHTTCLLGAAKILSELKERMERYSEINFSTWGRKKSGRSQHLNKRRCIGKSVAGSNFCVAR